MNTSRKRWTAKHRSFPSRDNFLTSLHPLESRVLLSVDLFVSSGWQINRYNGTNGATVAAPFIGQTDPSHVAVFGSDIYVTDYTSGKIAHYTTSGATVNAAFITGLTSPTAIAANASNIFILTGSTIARYTTSGTLLSANLLPSITNAASIAVSGSDLYIGRRDGTVALYDTAGNLVNLTLVSGIGSPKSIAVTGSDLFILTNSTIRQYTTSGTLVTSNLIPGLVGPSSITAAGSDLYVRGNMSFSHYNTSGALLGSAGNSTGSLWDIAASSAGIVSVDGQNVDIFTPSLAPVHTILGLSQCSSIQIVGNDFYTANVNISTIGHYTTSGTSIDSSFIQGLQGPEDIAVSGNLIYATDVTSGTVAVYDTSGNVINKNLITGLNQPCAILVSGNDLYVSTPFAGGAIRKYTTSGQLVNANFITGAASYDMQLLGNNLYVLNGNYIRQYDTSGNLINPNFVSGLISPSSFCFAGPYLFVANNSQNGANGSVAEYTSSGALINSQLVKNLTNPHGIAAIYTSPINPAIAWNNPAAISYGTPLSATQFNASSSASGTFSYNYPVGTLLPAGNHTLSVTFTPFDNTYSTATASVALTVLKAVPSLALASSSNPAATTQPITFTATLTSPTAGLTGTVQFRVDGNTLGGPVAIVNGKATSPSIASLVAGDHAVTAVFSGDLNFATTQGALTETINAVVTQPPSSPNAPTGAIDSLTTSVLKGWAYDKDTRNAPVAIRIDVDNTTVGTTTANLSHPNLSAVYGPLHGFSYTLPALSVGLHHIDVYALDTTTSVPKFLGSRTINTNIPPKGAITFFNGAALVGYAFDANSGATPIQVRYKLDTNSPTSLTASRDRPDLLRSLGSTLHGFSIALPPLLAGRHTVTVWAVDPVTQALTLLGIRTATVGNPLGNPRPVGKVETLTATLVSGYAVDGRAPINVRVDIDGVMGTPTLAIINRPSLLARFHRAKVGFSIPLSLISGTHRVEVFVIDSSGKAFLLRSVVVTAP